MSTPTPRAPVPRGWWSRNGKVILGCSAAVVLLVLFVGAIAVFVFSMLRDNSVTKLALAYAKQDPVVAEKLGKPIELGWLISGSIHMSGGAGHAQLALPLRGSKRKGTLYAVAERRAGEWTFSTLVLRIEGESEPVDLLRDQSRGT